MEILLPIPTNQNQEWQQQVYSLATQPCLIPFDPILRQFVQTVASELMSAPQIRNYPELAALAYWMRKAHIQQLMQDYHYYYQNSVALPRGVVLHIAPTNVDSIFMYSWFLALLTGNANIIRLSPHRDKQLELLLAILSDILQRKAFEPIRSRNLIISYGHEDHITQMLSANCQVRVIWGGDETIRHIRSIPLPPNAIEIPFADKFSLCALNARRVAAASAAELATLVEHFFNDAFWFNQNACSSPRLVVWVGNEPDLVTAQRQFWQALTALLTAKGLTWEPAMRINRMVAGYSLAAQGMIDSMSSPTAELPYRVHIKRLTPTLRQQHPGNGLFFETEIAELCELIASISPKDQTLSVYGFSNQELRDFALKLHNPGLSRIVPVGQSLTFHPIWDGINLLTAFSRECTIL